MAPAPTVWPKAPTTGSRFSSLSAPAVRPPEILDEANDIEEASGANADAGPAIDDDDDYDDYDYDDDDDDDHPDNDDLGNSHANDTPSAGVTLSPKHYLLGLLSLIVVLIGLIMVTTPAQSPSDQILLPDLEPWTLDVEAAPFMLPEMVAEVAESWFNITTNLINISDRFFEGIPDGKLRLNEDLTNRLEAWRNHPSYRARRKRENDASSQVKTFYHTARMQAMTNITGTFSLLSVQLSGLCEAIKRVHGMDFDEVGRRCRNAQAPLERAYNAWDKIFHYANVWASSSPHFILSAGAAIETVGDMMHWSSIMKSRMNPEGQSDIGDPEFGFEAPTAEDLIGDGHGSLGHKLGSIPVATGAQELIDLLPQKIFSNRAGSYLGRGNSGICPDSNGFLNQISDESAAKIRGLVAEMERVPIVMQEVFDLVPEALDRCRDRNQLWKHLPQYIDLGIDSIKSLMPSLTLYTSIVEDFLRDVDGICQRQHDIRIMAERHRWAVSRLEGTDDQGNPKVTVVVSTVRDPNDMLTVIRKRYTLLEARSTRFWPVWREVYLTMTETNKHLREILYEELFHSRYRLQEIRPIWNQIYTGLLNDEIKHGIKEWRLAVPKLLGGLPRWMHGPVERIIDLVPPEWA